MGRNRLPTAAVLLMSAFLAPPAHGYIHFPPPEERRKRVPALNEILTRNRAK